MQHAQEPRSPKSVSEFCAQKLLLASKQQLNKTNNNNNTFQTNYNKHNYYDYDYQKCCRKQQQQQQQQLQHKPCNAFQARSLARLHAVAPPRVPRLRQVNAAAQRPTQPPPPPPMQLQLLEFARPALAHSSRKSPDAKVQRKTQTLSRNLKFTSNNNSISIDSSSDKFKNTNSLKNDDEDEQSKLTQADIYLTNYKNTKLEQNATTTTFNSSNSLLIHHHHHQQTFELNFNNKVDNNNENKQHQTTQSKTLTSNKQSQLISSKTHLALAEQARRWLSAKLSVRASLSAAAAATTSPDLQLKAPVASLRKAKPATNNNNNGNNINDSNTTKSADKFGLAVAQSAGASSQQLTACSEQQHSPAVAKVCDLQMGVSTSILQQTLATNNCQHQHTKSAFTDDTKKSAQQQQQLLLSDNFSTKSQSSQQNCNTTTSAYLLRKTNKQIINNNNNNNNNNSSSSECSSSESEKNALAVNICCDNSERQNSLLDDVKLLNSVKRGDKANKRCTSISCARAKHCNNNDLNDDDDDCNANELNSAIVMSAIDAEAINAAQLRTAVDARTKQLVTCLRSPLASQRAHSSASSGNVKNMASCINLVCEQPLNKQANFQQQQRHTTTQALTNNNTNSVNNNSNNIINASKNKTKNQQQQQHLTRGCVSDAQIGARIEANITEITIGSPIRPPTVLNKQQQSAIVVATSNKLKDDKSTNESYELSQTICKFDNDNNDDKCNSNAMVRACESATTNLDSPRMRPQLTCNLTVGDAIKITRKSIRLEPCSLPVVTQAVLDCNTNITTMPTAVNLNSQSIKNKNEIFNNDSLLVDIATTKTKQQEAQQQECNQTPIINNTVNADANIVVPLPRSRSFERNNKSVETTARICNNNNSPLYVKRVQSSAAIIACNAQQLQQTSIPSINDSCQQQQQQQQQSRSIFDGASKAEILEYLEDARGRVPEVLMAADEVMVINENELIVVNQLEEGAPATPISIDEFGVQITSPLVVASVTAAAAAAVVTTDIIPTATITTTPTNIIATDIPIDNQQSKIIASQSESSTISADLENNVIDAMTSTNRILNISDRSLLDSCDDANLYNSKYNLQCNLLHLQQNDSISNSLSTSIDNLSLKSNEIQQTPAKTSSESSPKSRLTRSRVVERNDSGLGMEIFNSSQQQQQEQHHQSILADDKHLNAPKKLSTMSQTDDDLLTSLSLPQHTLTVPVPLQLNISADSNAIEINYRTDDKLDVIAETSVSPTVSPLLQTYDDLKVTSTTNLTSSLDSSAAQARKRDFGSFSFEFKCVDCDRSINVGEMLDMPSPLLSNNQSQMQAPNDTSLCWIRSPTSTISSGVDSRSSSSSSSGSGSGSVSASVVNDNSVINCERQSGCKAKNLLIDDYKPKVNREALLPADQIERQLEREFVRTLNALPLCKNCEKCRIERKETISEFVDTELKYGRDLKIIYDEFYRPMQVAGLLNKDQINGVFLNLEELIIANCAFSDHLCRAINEALLMSDTCYNSVKIGKVFNECANMLHSFETYCVRQGTAACLLARLAKEKELLRIFLRVSQMENALLRRMNLAAFLMVPVQRVTKYPLLISRLYKVTPYHHKDRQALREAQLKVELHLEHINQQTKGASAAANKIWRRISSLSAPIASKRVQIDTEDIGSMKLKKIALELLKWDRDETQFIHSGKLSYTGLNEYLVKHKSRSLRYSEAHALLVILGKPNWQYRPDLVKPNSNHHRLMMRTSAGGFGIKEAALVLLREKGGRFVACREPLYLKNCIMSADCSQYNQDYQALSSSSPPYQPTMSVSPINEICNNSTHCQQTQNIPNLKPKLVNTQIDNSSTNTGNICKRALNSNSSITPSWLRSFPTSDTKVVANSSSDSCSSNDGKSSGSSYGFFVGQPRSTSVPSTSREQRKSVINTQAKCSPLSSEAQNKSTTIDTSKPNFCPNAITSSFGATQSNTGIPPVSAPITLANPKNQQQQHQQQLQQQKQQSSFLHSAVVFKHNLWYGNDEEAFELHELTTKESLLIRADTAIKTRYWRELLRYHAKDLGAWRDRRNALANIMMVTQQQRQ